MDLITKTKAGPCIYQGGEDAPAQARIKGGKYLLVSLAGGFEHDGEAGIEPMLSVFIDDHPTKDDMEVLPDDELFAMLDSSISFLRRGFSVIIYCIAGKHRSTYFDIALHMRYMHIPYGDAWAWVKSKHKMAEERKNGTAQLKRLEKELML